MKSTLNLRRLFILLENMYLTDFILSLFRDLGKNKLK